MNARLCLSTRQIDYCKTWGTILILGGWALNAATLHPYNYVASIAGCLSLAMAAYAQNEKQYLFLNTVVALLVVISYFTHM